METRLEFMLVNSHKAEMISYLKSHPEDFEEVIKLAISDKQPYSWRAAWVLWSCMDKNDKRVGKYLRNIINVITTKQDNQQRELLMILLRMELSESLERQLFDICMKIWKIVDKNPSLRYNAFKHLVNISKKHPELTKKIRPLTETHYIEMLSGNVKKSILKLSNESKNKPLFTAN
jgi:hypothetical protein